VPYGKKFGRRPNPAHTIVVSHPVSALAVDDAWEQADDDRAPARRPPTEFDVIFDAHYERLVRALTLVAGDAETAADAVQEAFVKAHLRWRRISRYDDPVGWVRRVAINQLRDDHRRQGRKHRAMTKLSSREQTVAMPPELDEFDRLLAELPKQQRATTALFYVDGLTVAEIAAALGIAEGSVKSHLHDARKRLKPILEREAGPVREPGDRP
jgi:RNA polymerase sigma-70 factor, ECF subfamily